LKREEGNCLTTFKICLDTAATAYDSIGLYDNEVSRILKKQICNPIDNKKELLFYMQLQLYLQNFKKEVRQ